MKPPGPSAHADLRRRAAALLASSPGPMSSAALAETLLGMVKAPEEAAQAVLDPILGEDERFVRAPDEGWRLAGHAPLDERARVLGTFEPGETTRRRAERSRSTRRASRDRGSPAASPTAASSDPPSRARVGATLEIHPEERPGPGPSRRGRRFIDVEGAEAFVDPSSALAVERRAIVLGRRAQPSRREDGSRAANAPGISAPRAWAVWEIDPELRAAAVVRIEDGIVAAERAETSEAHGPSRSRASRGRTLSPAALRRLAACARGARCAHFASGGTAAMLRLALTDAGALSGDADAQHETAPLSDWLGLPRAALAILGPPRPRSIEALAARLGERIVAADSPLERARAAATCLSRLLEIAAAAAAGGGDSASAAGLLDRSPETERTWTVGEPAADGISIRLAARIASLPASAGIYRFLSEDGGLLYVGKAVNLRRRVASYFHARSTPDPRIAPWIGRVARIEIDETGSEPEALVREAETIIRSAPSANRQRAVHDRPAPPFHSPRRGLASSENVVLLLRAPKGGLVHAHLLRRGVPIARVSLGPRGGGTRTLRSQLRRIYFTSDDDSPLPQSESRRRRAALFASWLARQNRPVSAFDPTDTASVDDALAIALRYASGLRRGETGVVYRA